MFGEGGVGGLAFNVVNMFVFFYLQITSFSMDPLPQVKIQNVATELLQVVNDYERSFAALVGYVVIQNIQCAETELERLKKVKERVRALAQELSGVRQQVIDLWNANQQLLCENSVLKQELANKPKRDG